MSSAGSLPWHHYRIGAQWDVKRTQLVYNKSMKIRNATVNELDMFYFSGRGAPMRLAQGWTINFIKKHFRWTFTDSPEGKNWSPSEKL